MDHISFLLNYFGRRQLRCHYQWNCFQPPYDHDKGWPLALPDVDWSQNDCLLIVMQDFVTMRDGICLELQQIEHHYGSQAHRVIVLHWPHDLARYYRGALHLVEFNVHEHSILRNLQNNSDWHPVWNQSRTHQWQCLNGRRCAHRLRTVQVLDEWPGGVLSYGEVIELPEWNYRTYRGTSNEDNFLRLMSVYGSCVFNIVTETQFDQVPGIISEKTVFCLLSAQIPIMIGYRGIVSDCRALGFDMFDDVVDHSYDTLSDDQRVAAALELNRDRILNYRPEPDIQARLTQQAHWILHSWPEQQLVQLEQQLDQVLNLQGF